MDVTTADLLIVNARVWSEGARREGVDAIAVAGGNVLAVDRGAALESLSNPRTRRVDARGATVTPGITDAHIHLVQWARAQDELSLHGAATRGEALARLERHLVSHPGPGPVVGRGWDANGWSEPPERGAIDRVAGERPVLLHSRDFHALWVNSAALVSAGVTRATPDPEGGRIERDASGEPTGVVREHAVRRFAALEAAAAAGASDLSRVRRAAVALLSLGVTAVHDFEGPEAQRVLRQMTEADGPRVRVLMHLAHAGLGSALALGLESGVGDDWFRIGAVKLFADGTLGSRTAAMLEPYDGTQERGMELMPAAEIRRLVALSFAGRISVAIHAIGDRACRSSLDAFEEAGPELRAGVRLAPRIEHAQLVAPPDLDRFARLGVAASMQPVHCTSDLPLVERWWRSRAANAYPWHALRERGALLAFGSDAPVEHPGVAEGLHAAVTRERADGTPAGGFVPAQRLSLDAALSAYTEGPARLAGSWPRLGRIAPGATADLVVWNADLHALPGPALREAAPALVVLEGAVAFEAASEPLTRAAAGGQR